MEVYVESAPNIEDIKIVTHQVFEDHRGYFMEVYRKDEFEKNGLPTNFVQQNQSRSSKGVVRGLHFQWEPPMGKMMRVISGEAFLVAVDIRKGSPTLGQWFGTIISSENKKQLWAPAGFARGFAVLSETAEIEYKVTGIYNKACESGIKWDDPAIGIDWPVDEPILSEKDDQAQTLEEWLETKDSDNFKYGEKRANS